MHKCWSRTCQQETAMEHLNTVGIGFSLKIQFFMSQTITLCRDSLGIILQFSVLNSLEQMHPES